jgi:BirA family biotin operon repressor/biotin-[acetyl-CoA-carboxylase] ligase
MAGVACDLRWPNDLLLNEKKLGGIMVQAADNGALIAGIGVNVNQTAFPAEIRAIATSLRIETGREYSKRQLLDRIVAESLHYSNLLADRGKGPILAQFERRSTYVRGKAVDVDVADRTITGITAGLDDHGFLRVQTSDGSVETIVAGGVRPRA